MCNAEYVTVFTKGNKLDDNDCVVLCLAGPRGGTRALETVSLEVAKALIVDLSDAVSKIEQK